MGKISDWTEVQLARFVQSTLQQQSAIPKAQKLENVEVTKKLIVSDQIQLSPQAIAYIKHAVGL